MMKSLKRKLLMLLLCCLPLGVQAADNKPFTIPEIKSWQGRQGVLQPLRISYKQNDALLLRTVKQFAADYATMFGVQLPVVKGKAQKGDIFFELAPKRKAGEESYTLRIAEWGRVSAPHAKGLFWATRTLLQMAEQQPGHALPCGDVADAPDYPIRGFMIDCGRKFFPMSSLREYVRLLSYYKMNTFHIHLNDNGFPAYFSNDWLKTQAAFRLECDTYPGLTSRDGYYTKKEFIDLQLLADSLGVEIIPEIDVPAHSLAFTHYKPSLAGKDYGMDHLDLFNPETYTFLDALFKEYLAGPNPVFRGPRVHIGTDEYSNESPRVVEKFRYFADRYIRYVEGFGKQAVIWGQQSHARGTTPIKVNDVLMASWSNDYSEPNEMLKLGYDLISVPDRDMYIVPMAGYYRDYLDSKSLYAKWTPAHINGKTFEERHPKIKGGMFAVWNDVVGNGVSVQDVYHRVVPAVQTLATKMWTGATPTFSFDNFDKQRHALSEAPGLNALARQPAGFSLTLNELKPGDTTGLEEIGWNYRVSFDIEAVKEEPGTVLLASKQAKFYLSDPAAGLLGFSRDGYLYHFNYRFYPGEKVRVTIEGTPETTMLYVNGKKMESLDVKKMTFEKKVELYYLSTLIFPLQKAGNFKSRITNFSVKAE